MTMRAKDSGSNLLQLLPKELLSFNILTYLDAKSLALAEGSCRLIRSSSDVAWGKLEQAVLPHKAAASERNTAKERVIRFVVAQRYCRHVEALKQCASSHLPPINLAAYENPRQFEWFVRIASSSDGGEASSTTMEEEDSVALFEGFVSGLDAPFVSPFTRMPSRNMPIVDLFVDKAGGLCRKPRELTSFHNVHVTVAALEKGSSFSATPNLMVASDWLPWQEHLGLSCHDARCPKTGKKVCLIFRWESADREPMTVTTEDGRTIALDQRTLAMTGIDGPPTSVLQSEFRGITLFVLNAK